VICVEDNNRDASVTLNSPLPISNTIQQLLIDTYSVIGEPDGLYGTMASQDVNPAARVKFYHHEENWHRALSAYNLLHFQPLQPDGLLQVSYKVFIYCTSHCIY